MPRGGARPGAGHPRKPRTVKEAQGSLNATRERRLDEKVKAATKGMEFVSVPDAPEEWPPYQVDAWDELRTQVDAIGTYTETDYSAFKTMALLYAKFERAGIDLEIETPHGTRVRSDASVLVALAGRLQNFFTKFGLDPASRATVPSRRVQQQGEAEDKAKFDDGPPDLKVVS